MKVSGEKNTKKNYKKLCIWQKNDKKFLRGLNWFQFWFSGYN